LPSSFSPLTAYWTWALVQPFATGEYAGDRRQVDDRAALAEQLLHAIYGMFATNAECVAEEFYAVASETA
jgi:hypothetical protein